MANIWMHNGFLQVEGEKMSKILGNFVTIRELLETGSFGDNVWHGRVLRFAMLTTHYRQPIDWARQKGDVEAATKLSRSMRFLGLWNGEPSADIYAYGVEVSDGPGDAEIEAYIAARLEARRAKNFTEADRIRAELDGMGIALKDAKDPVTGEIVTTWEVKR
jgi:cysteinyl-tRNA synthetase